MYTRTASTIFLTQTTGAETRARTLKECSKVVQSVSQPGQARKPQSRCFTTGAFMIKTVFVFLGEGGGCCSLVFAGNRAGIPACTFSHCYPHFLFRDREGSRSAVVWLVDFGLVWVWVPVSRFARLEAKLT